MLAPAGVVRLVPAIWATSLYSPITRSAISCPPLVVRPAERFMFCAWRACTTLLMLKPWAASFSGSTVTWISRVNPPVTSTEATPSSRSSRGLMTSSAIVFNSSTGRSPLMPSSSTGIMLRSIFKTMGSPAPSGRYPLIMSIFSLISRAAKSMSVSISNSAMTMELPMEDIELMLLMLPTVPSASSSGLLIRVSTSCGAEPS